MASGDLKRVDRNVYRMPDGRFLVRLTRKDGDERHETVRILETRAYADEFVRRWKTARSFATAGLAPPVSPEVLLKASKRTLGTILLAYEKELVKLGRAPATIRSLQTTAKFLKEGLGEDHAVPLTRADLVELVAWGLRERNTKGDALAKAFVAVRTAHRRAGLPPPDPPELRFEREGRRVLTGEQLAALLEAMPWGSTERTAAEIILGTACREIEAFRLKVEDVDLQGGVIRFETRKGPRARRIQSQRVPISPPLAAALRAYAESFGRRRAPTEPLLVVGKGKTKRSLKGTSLRKRMMAASARAKLKPYVTSLGFLRNAALTTLGEAKVAVEVASRIAGHASVKTTENHYDGAIRWDERVEAVKVLAAARPGGRKATPRKPHTPRGKGAVSGTSRTDGIERTHGTPEDSIE